MNIKKSKLTILALLLASTLLPACGGSSSDSAAGATEKETNSTAQDEMVSLTLGIIDEAIILGDLFSADPIPEGLDRQSTGVNAGYYEITEGGISGLFIGFSNDENMGALQPIESLATTSDTKEFHVKMFGTSTDDLSSLFVESEINFHINGTNYDIELTPDFGTKSSPLEAYISSKNLTVDDQPVQVYFKQINGNIVLTGATSNDDLINVNSGTTFNNYLTSYWATNESEIGQACPSGNIQNQITFTGSQGEDTINITYETSLTLNSTTSGQSSTLITSVGAEENISTENITKTININCLGVEIVE